MPFAELQRLVWVLHVAVACALIYSDQWEYENVLCSTVQHLPCNQVTGMYFPGRTRQIN